MTALGSGSPVVVTTDDRRLQTALDDFCRPSVGRSTATDAVEAIAEILLQRTPGIGAVDLLVPIARAGLALLRPADIATRYADVLFSMCRRTSAGITMTWSPPRIADRATNALILDIVTATGGTLDVVVPALRRQAPSLRSITIVTCFATPEALERLATHDRGDLVVVVGRVCGGVDADGYVWPPTNGDTGDKLFGRVGESESSARG